MILMRGTITRDHRFEIRRCSAEPTYRVRRNYLYFPFDIPAEYVFDDLRTTIRKIRGDYSKNQETSIRKGRKVVQENVGLISLGVLGALLFGFMEFRDGGLLLLYGGAPFVLDSSLFLETIPLVSRFAPRITFMLEIGIETAAVGVGISLSTIYSAYRAIGAVSMGIPYYRQLKDDD